MADDDTTTDAAEDHSSALHPNAGGTGAAGATTPDKVKQRRDAKIAIAVGIVGAILAWLTYKKSASSASTSTSAVPTSTVGAGTTAPAYGDVAGWQGSGGQGADMGALANALNTLSGQLGQLPAGAAASSGTGAGPGETPGTPGTPGAAAPAAQPADIAAGYTQITTPQEGSNLSASGVPIYVGVGGLSGPVVPFKSGTQYAPGSTELYKTGSAGGV